MSSTFLRQAIAENSARHSQLLDSLKDLEGIPNELKEKTKLVEDLQSELEECETKVSSLFEKTREQRRNADPGIIPGGRKISQVFRGRKEKEREREREEKNKRLFAEAMAEETKERDRQRSIEQELSKAQTSKSDLLRRMKDYDDIVGKIDALYALIFNGPTPGFPKEDELEQAVQASISVVHRTRTEFNKENEALEILSRSDKTFRECQSKLKDAIYWATASMLAGGRTAEAKETASLRIAHSLAQKAQSLVRDAQQYSAYVRTLENPSIARELPVRKENDTEFHEVLKKLAAELGNTYSQLISERKACADRTEECKNAVLEAEQAVADHKRELHELRKATFLDVVSKLKSGELEEPTELDFEVMQDAPPSYDQQLGTQSYSQPGMTSALQEQTPAPLPPELIIAKQEHTGPFRQISADFVAPPYDMGPSYDMGMSGPSSPVSTYSVPAPGYTSQHASYYFQNSPLPPTPSTSRPEGARPRTARRPLPRVPQPNSR